MIEIRGSEAQTFQRCRLKWKYQWQDGLKPKRPNGKLWFGTLFHKWIEVYYSTGSWEQAHAEAYKLFKSTDTSAMDQVAIDDLWIMVDSITHHYKDHWYEVDQNFKTIATELSFRIPINDDVMYYGTIDRIYLDEDDRLWFMDHKTVASMDQYQDKAEMDRQISRYWWALQQLSEGIGEIMDQSDFLPVTEVVFHDLIKNKEIAGFIYNLIKKDYPEAPKELKSGKLSTDKRQKTTRDLYMRALKERFEEIPEEYFEILNYLAEQDNEENNRWFRRVQVFRTQGEVNASIEELCDVVQDMKNPRIYRHITGDCSWDCDYKGLCVASMDGSNVDMLINLMYNKEEIPNG